MATSCRSCQIAREIYKHFLKACAHIQTVKSLVLRSISGAEALKIHPGRLERPQPLAETSPLTRSSGKPKERCERDRWIPQSDCEWDARLFVCDCVRVWRNSAEISNYQGGVWKGLSALEDADWAEGWNISEMVRFVCALCSMWVVICSEQCNAYAIENKTMELWPSGFLKFCAHVGNVSFESDFFPLLIVSCLLSKIDTMGRWMQCIYVIKKQNLRAAA